MADHFVLDNELKFISREDYFSPLSFPEFTCSSLVRGEIPHFDISFSIGALF